MNKTSFKIWPYIIKSWQQNYEHPVEVFMYINYMFYYYHTCVYYLK